MVIGAPAGAAGVHKFTQFELVAKFVMPCVFKEAAIALGARFKREILYHANCYHMFTMLIIR